MTEHRTAIDYDAKAPSQQLAFSPLDYNHQPLNTSQGFNGASSVLHQRTIGARKDEDLEDRDDTSSSSKQNPMTKGLRKIGDNAMETMALTNPWELASSATFEFAGTMLLSAITIIAYAYNKPDPDNLSNWTIGATAAAGAAVALYYMFSVFSRAHFSCASVLYYLARKQMGWYTAGVLMVAIVGGYFAGAGVGLLISGQSNYNDTVSFVVKVGSSTSDTMKAFATEIVGSTVVLLIPLLAAHFNSKHGMTSLVMGATVLFTQLAAYKISGAAFIFERFLAFNALTGSNAYWPGSQFWIYLVAPVIAWFICFVGILIFEWINKNRQTWQPNPSYVKIDQ